MKEVKPKKCKTCKKPFTPFNSLQKYCSKQCEPKKEITAGKARKRINPMSEKRKVDAKVYSTLRSVFLESRPECQVKLFDICTGKATDVHHRERRGENYLNVKTFVAACRACHTYIETHPAWSRENGWLR